MVDYFFKIDNVPGDSHDAHHPNEIEVVSFAWGESNVAPLAASGAGAGKVHIEDFHFAAVTSSASPRLMLLCANGKHVVSAVLVARRPGSSQQEYLKVTLNDVTVAAYHVSASSGDVPLDEVSLRFSKVEIDYRPEKATGALGAAVHAGWDAKLNKPL
ncbi:MAG: type VI secretion system tube protein Hcp [Ilumatobacteraceae bacterium]